VTPEEAKTSFSITPASLASHDRKTVQFPNHKAA